MLRLPLSFFERHTLQVVQDIIGRVLVHESEEGLTSGVVVEAEAYRGEDDPASFASKGKTKRSEMLFAPPGRAFVYLTYGMYHLLNIITEKEAFPAAILIRALEPREGISLMKERRGREELKELCSGPGKLCQALGVDLSLNGEEVFSPRSRLYFTQGKGVRKNLVWRPRIGINEGKDRFWRVYDGDSPFISAR
ncbi:MAG: DNA-3-methyladenine glycosylase [Candidatus Aminicenantales bacterium]